ncbi:putative gustatory receptor 28b [Polistes fuscatus]|uniref:putative gustatory receptor 28b n=1 Tax=Polistes fuscatus TaxID=30207 RepID=UPI001CA98F87|nr:putative gustatory receptor 28b [Polistes fuscatus]
MLTTTVDLPQHAKVLRMKDNWENDLSLSIIYRTYKANENLIKLKRIEEIHLELIKCARNANDAYGIHILMSISTAFFLITIAAYNLLHAKNTGDILCELYEPSISKELRAEIRDFIIQLIQNPLLLTTCGFFNLDYTLITNVISTVTTYLVILIQVGDKPEPFYPNSTLSTIDF